MNQIAAVYSINVKAILYTMLIN